MLPLCFPFDVLSRVLSGQEIVAFIASLCSGTSFQQSTKQCSGTLAPTVSQILDGLCGVSSWREAAGHWLVATPPREVLRLLCGQPSFSVLHFVPQSQSVVKSTPSF